jgi:hypothetical protein
MFNFKEYMRTKATPPRSPETLSQSFERMGIGEIGGLGGRMGELEKASLRLAEASAQRESRLLDQSGQQAYELQGLIGRQEYGLQGLRGRQKYGLQKLRGQQSLAQQSLIGIQQGQPTPMTSATANYLGARIF